MHTGKFNAFFNAYITAALWTDCDDDRTASDLAPETMEKMKADCLQFVGDHYQLLTTLDDHGLHSFELSGHDFWLTRNGHGAGFWDRGLNVAGEMLTKGAEEFGNVALYEGDDNLIYLGG